MKFLLDTGLPRTAVQLLANHGVESVHVGEIGMSAADDSIILAHAAEHQFVIVTLDADFHTLLAIRGDRMPSAIRIRIEGLKGPGIAAVILRVLSQFTTELREGAVISVGVRTARCHRLPLK